MVDETQMENYLYEILEKMIDEELDTQSPDFFRELEETLVWDTNTFNDCAKEYGTFEVEDDRGGEGQGEEYYTVFSFTDLNGEKNYFKFEGYYSSWEGVYYDDAVIEEVIPKEVTIIKWETK